MPTRIGPRVRYTIADVHRVLDGPLELIVDGAEAYWLEDDGGHGFGPESERSLAPLFLALDLAREGRDPETLRLKARLRDGDRFEIASGAALIEIAEHAAGVPRRPRDRKQERSGSRDESQPRGPGNTAV